MTTRILVVDDEPDLELLFRQRFRQKIRAGEVELSFASNGKEALEVLVADPDLQIMLTDINMPEMDGLTLLSRVRELDRNLETVIISAYGDMDNIRLAMNRGAFDFLTKPLDFQDLDLTIEKTRQQVQRTEEGEKARRMAAELEEKNRFVRETFGRYVPEKVVRHLLDSPEGLELGGEKRRVTVLTTNLRGFTGLAERTPPEVIVTLLNRYFEAMFEVVMAHDGTVTEMTSAGLSVVFGAPVEVDDAARRALSCAVALREALAEFNNENERQELPRLAAGFGVDSGEVVVGNVGSARRAKYGVVGSHVMLAARVESYATGGQILASDAALEEAGDGVRVDASLEIRPRGFQRSVVVHDIGDVVGD